MRGPQGAGWVDGELGRVYDPGQWQARPEGQARPPERWTLVGCARRGANWPFRAGETRPWGDLATGVLRAAAGGVELHICLEPLSVGRNSGLPPIGGSSTAASRAGWNPAPLPWERRVRDAVHARPFHLAWSARIGVRVGSTTARVRLGSLVTGLESASALPGANGLKFRSTRWPRAGRRPPILLTDAEVAALLPHPEAWAPPPAELASRSPLLLGWDPSRRPVRLTVEAQQGRHLLVLGETGMGKSSLLVSLAVAAVDIGSVLFFDPIGDTARRFIAALSDSQLRRTTLVSPKDSPVPINALGAAGGFGADAWRRERALADLVVAMRRVRSARYSDSAFWGPRLEEMATLALRAAAERADGTLLDALRLLSGEHEVGRDSGQRGETAAMLRRRHAERPDDGEGARRLLAEVLGSPAVSGMLSDASATWAISRALEPGRITIFSADAPTVGEGPARHLLAVYLALTWSELVGRNASAKTFIVLDEAQWYAHGSAAEMLRLGRRANVHLWLATQALASLPEELGEAVLTNAADFLLFRGSPQEAREFARWAPGLQAAELLGLPRGRGLALLGKGERVSPLRTVGARSVAPSTTLRAQVDRLREQAEGQGLLPRPPGLRHDATDPCPPLGGTPPPADPAALLRAMAQLLQAARGPIARVELAALRALADPAGLQVRQWGSELRSFGVLRGTGRADAGGYWLIDVPAWQRYSGGENRPATPVEPRPGHRAGGAPNASESAAEPGQGF